MLLEALFLFHACEYDHVT